MVIGKKKKKYAATGQGLPERKKKEKEKYCFFETGRECYHQG